MFLALVLRFDFGFLFQERSRGSLFGYLRFLPRAFVRKVASSSWQKPKQDGRSAAFQRSISILLCFSGLAFGMIDIRHAFRVAELASLHEQRAEKAAVLFSSLINTVDLRGDWLRMTLILCPLFSIRYWAVKSRTDQSSLRPLGWTFYMLDSKKI